MMPRHQLAALLLEEQGTLLHAGVHLAIDEDTSAEILLRSGAEFFVFGHDALVHGGDDLEVGIGGEFVAVDFVAHDGAGWTGWDEALHEEEVRARVWSAYLSHKIPNGL